MTARLSHLVRDIDPISHSAAAAAVRTNADRKIIERVPGVSRHPQSSHPQIVWLPIGEGADAELFPTALTGLPGSRDAAAVATMDEDILHLVSQNIGRVVLLVTEQQLVPLGLMGLPTRLRRFGVEVVWRPVGSSSPPELLFEMSQWVLNPPYRASTALTARTVKGRAAMMAAGVINESGIGIEAAVARVRRAAGDDAIWPGQEAAIARFARYRQTLPKSDFGAIRGIRSRDLRRVMIPHPYAPWFPDLNAFALSFDGYARYGTQEEIAAVGNKLHRDFELTGTLPPAIPTRDLRAALFGVQRQQHHEGDPPEPHQMPFIWALVEGIHRAARP